MRCELATRVSSLCLLAVSCVSVWRGGTGVRREQGLSRLTPVSLRGFVWTLGGLLLRGMYFLFLIFFFFTGFVTDLQAGCIIHPTI